MISRLPQRFQTSAKQPLAGVVVRPIQLRAYAEDAAFRLPTASQVSTRLDALRMPVTVIAGERDTVVDVQAHSARLHAALPGSRLVIVPGAGLVG